MRLSPGTRRRVDFLFSRPDRDTAAHILMEDCGNSLPGCASHDEHALDRIRFAALKVSNGSLPLLRDAVALAKLDWRDLLTAASFAVDVHAHESWPTAKRPPRARSVG